VPLALAAGPAPGQPARQVLLISRKRLLNDTDLPIAEIAFRAGFGSVRRFNDALKETYGRPPSSFRR